MYFCILINEDCTNIQLEYVYYLIRCVQLHYVTFRYFLLVPVTQQFTNNLHSAGNKFQIEIFNGLLFDSQFKFSSSLVLLLLHTTSQPHFLACTMYIQCDNVYTYHYSSCHFIVMPSDLLNHILLLLNTFDYCVWLIELIFTFQWQLCCLLYSFNLRCSYYLSRDR